MRANVLSTTLYKTLLITGVILLVGSNVFAVSETELRNRAKELEVQVNEGKKDLSGAHKEVTTLQGKVNQLKSEINDLNDKIVKTNNSIDKTEKKLIKTEKELKRQEDVMNKSLRTLYKYGDVSTVELLASSESFTQFVNGQEYLARIKLAVQESAQKVADLRDNLEKEKADLDELLELHTGQQKIVASKKAEQAELLDKAKDKEFSYKKYVAKKQKEQRLVEDSIAAAVRSRFQNGFVSQGNVNNNAVIGYVGSTGNSTGAHLHFSTWNSRGVNQNPVLNASARTLRWGFSWPVNPSYSMTRGYQCSSHWAAATSSSCPVTEGGRRNYHAGVDIAAPEGTPIRALGKGQIVCKSNGGCPGVGPGGGNTVIIRHENGYESHYYHLSAFK